VSQGAIVTLVSLALYFASLLGGGAKAPVEHVESPPPIYQVDASAGTTTGGVVTGNTVVVYDAVGSRNQVGELHRGEYVDILAQEGSWYKVRLATGKTGYVTAFTLMPADSATRPARRANQPMVLGYYLSGQYWPSRPSMISGSNVLTALAPWTWEVKADGDLAATFDVQDTALALKYAGEGGMRTYALIHNVAPNDRGHESFNSSLAHRLLTNPQARSRLVANILRTLRDWRMTGVHIDFEMVQPQDRQALTDFMRELYGTLHAAGFEITMAVPSKTRESLSDSWAGAFDYGALSRYVDQMMLMTYDEHWSGGPAGPVASVGWVEKVVAYALSAGVPPEKLVLGIPAYGYDWPRRGTGRAVSYETATQIARDNGQSIQWDSTAKVPYFRYGDGRQVWFENRQSLSHKLALVSKYNLGGIALWRLGQEDPGYWHVIDDMLG
jgi:spore germination protein